MVILFPISYVVVIVTLLAITGHGRRYSKHSGPSPTTLVYKQYWRDSTAAELAGLDPNIVPIPRS